MDTDDEIAAPFVGPAVETARSLGLEVQDPVVLGARANVVIHLAPSPVVARVAALTAEMRGTPADYLRRELEISAALHEAGVPAIGPTRLVDPGPHTVGGLTFSFLEHVHLRPVDINSEHDAKAAGRALVELSEVLQQLPADVGAGDAGQPWAEVATLFDTVRADVEPSVLARIRGVLEDLRASEPDEPRQLVHGDAHRVNVAFRDHRGRDGQDGTSGVSEILWFDFEEANLRPLSWDLATLRRSWPAAGDEACRILGVDPQSATMRWQHEFREVYALLWSMLYAQRFVGDQQPTAERLANWLAVH